MTEKWADRTVAQERVALDAVRAYWQNLEDRIRIALKHEDLSWETRDELISLLAKLRDERPNFVNWEQRINEHD